MDRRGLRAIIVLGLAVVPLLVLLAARAQVGGFAAAAAASAAASGGPQSSMAGPTTFAVIGPTAIQASRGWDDILAVPTPATTADPQLAPGSPRPTQKPVFHQRHGSDYEVVDTTNFR